MNNPASVREIKKKFPLRLFAVIFTLSVLFGTLSVFLEKREHKDIVAATQKHLDLTQYIDRTIFLDEVLTMSAQMGAVSGDPSFEKRYNQFDAELVDVIDEIKHKLPEQYNVISELDNANSALVKIEREAFSLAHQGKQQEAMNLLSGKDYVDLKSKYAGDVMMLRDNIKALVEQENKKIDSSVHLLQILNIGGSICLLFAWLLAFRAVRSWNSERKEFDRLLQKEHDSLEEQVADRTKELKLNNDLLEKEQEDLRDSRERLRLLLDSIEEGAYGVDTDGNIIFVNRAFLNMLGYETENEVFGKHAHDLFHHTHADGSVYPDSECKSYISFRTGQSTNISDEVFWRKDKTAIPIESWSHPIIDNGVVVGGITTFVGIAKRKEAEKKIVASELRYRRLFEAARDGILILDFETGTIVDVNPFLIELLGFSREEFLTKKIWELGFLKDILENKEQFEVLQKEGYVRYEDLPLKTVNGREAHIEFVSNVYLVDGEKVIQCNIRDITERRKMETVLEEGKIELVRLNEDLRIGKKLAEEGQIKDEALLSSLSEGMLTTDDTGVVTSVNRAAEDILGWRAGELIGKVFVDVIQAMDSDGVFISKENRPALLVSKQTRAEGFGFVPHPILASFYYVRKDGTRVPVTITATPIIIDGTFVGVMETFRDITVEKETERAREDLLALASHQLRTPLSGTKWLIETLQSGLKGELNKDQKEYLGEIYKINERMTNLVVEMLGVLRMESGVIPINKKQTSTMEILDVVFATFDSVAKSKHIALLFTKDADHILETDPLLLRNILESLVSNAITYSPPDGKIEVFLVGTPTGVMFSVKDYGIGIPKSEQGQLFERFYRASNAKTFNTRGTGLGLYIAMTLAQKIGAKITFESEEGKGSVFHVSVPAK